MEIQGFLDQYIPPMPPIPPIPPIGDGAYPSTFSSTIMASVVIIKEATEA